MQGKDSILVKMSILQKEQQKMLAVVADFSAEDLADQSNGWSVKQVFSHLNQAEEASLSYMQKKIKAGTEMPKVELIDHFKRIIVTGALRSSLRWKAPKFISTPPEPKSYQALLEDWVKTRERIKKFIEQYPEEYLGKAVYKHPAGGRQTLGMAVSSFRLHQFHHLHQIKRIKRKLQK